MLIFSEQEKRENENKLLWHQTFIKHYDCMPQKVVVHVKTIFPVLCAIAPYGIHATKILVEILDVDDALNQAWYAWQKTFHEEPINIICDEIRRLNMLKVAMVGMYDECMEIQSFILQGLDDETRQAFSDFIQRMVHGTSTLLDLMTITLAGVSELHKVASSYSKQYGGRMAMGGNQAPNHVAQS